MTGLDGGKCPFCLGTISVSDDPPATMHSLPACATFTRESPTDFLRHVNDAREKGAPV